MPEIGEVRGARTLGRNYNGRYIWAACGGCGKCRWIKLRGDKSKQIICHTCSRKKEYSSTWKGGRRKTSGGYIQVLLQPEDFFFSMADSHGYVMEHRLVMAKKLGVCLPKETKVHHKGIRYGDGIRNKSDNLEDNLE